MGKSWKDNKAKYKNNRDFQKKQGKKNKGHKQQNSFGGVPTTDWETWQQS
jgi:hypothetical protein